MNKRIAIFIVAYNAAGTLRQVLDRVPREVWEQVEEIFVFDDGSKDDTYLVGLGYKEFFGKAKLSVFRNDRNLGYGGNQIKGYQYAIEQGYDIVALLHGDGQYAPELLPQLIAPVAKGEAEAVFGSRMLTNGTARAGGMPLYKFVGNKILTTVENAMLGMNLSEFHSGYRVYDCHALAKLPFHENSSDFHFDTQIIIQLHAAGMRIREVPIPTYYGDEICHVNGLKYAKDVVKSVFEYKIHELGIHDFAEYRLPARYSMKTDPQSSHGQLQRLVGVRPQRVLDLGCGSGELGGRLRERGHYVVGVDARPPSQELDRFVKADLAEGVPDISERKFDCVILADVLEHLSFPEQLLEQALSYVQPAGRLLVSLPNVAHWSVRAQLAAGRFEYTNAGILDRTHLRFFTRSSARRLFRGAGLEIQSEWTTPVPWEKVVSVTPVSSTLSQIDGWLGQTLPPLFAYQYIFELRPSG